uniref:Uncharacterized protein n=1 Tax=Seriola lalandi dorsalis TaxID=1841481 RepID=A0A3B4YNX5_SERLL
PVCVSRISLFGSVNLCSIERGENLQTATTESCGRRESGLSLVQLQWKGGGQYMWLAFIDTEMARTILMFVIFYNYLSDLYLIKYVPRQGPMDCKVRNRKDDSVSRVIQELHFYSEKRSRSHLFPLSSSGELALTNFDTQRLG